MEENRKITYYSDAVHNYMVMECPPELKENYQYRMLAANQIKGLLSCSSRTIDSRDYLYYDITSRQNLTDIYERRPVRGSDLQELLQSLVRMEEVLTEYLLDAAHLLTDPDCIYLDFLEQSYSLTYYPGKEQSEGWTPLFTFLADRVDGSDKQAASLTYRLCMMAEKPGFRLRAKTLRELGISEGRGSMDARQNLYPRGSSPSGAPVFQQGLPLPAGRSGYDGNAPVSPNGGTNLRIPDGSQGKSRYYEEYSSCPAGEKQFPAADPYPGGFPGENTGDAESVMSESGQETKGSSGTGNRRWKIGLSCVLMAVGIFLFLLDRWMILEEQELLLSHAVGGALAAAGLVLLLLCLLRRRREDSVPRAGEDSEDREMAPWESSSCFPDGAAGPQGAASSAAYSPPYSPQYGRAETSGAYSYPYLRAEACAPYSSSSAQAPAAKEVAETCLLNRNPEMSAGLYGTGNFRGEQIGLSELPCVVGKMQEYVDHVLNDSSVSRMHARFSIERDGKMYVRDLNSTNGTWLNGERLKPNESRSMEPGDHIRLGRMEFVFR